MKPLVNPLLWFLLLQLAGLAALRYRYRTVMSRAWKLVWLVLALSLFGLGALSTPFVSYGLERSLLVVARDGGQAAPEYIFVLGGGYLPGHFPESDVLGSESIRRVLTAVSWWRECPQAKLVFSGALRGVKDRPDYRLARLMADEATRRGVPESRMLLEGISINTREHPLEALRLPGVTAETMIGLVTSGWHMRRARREFSRYFSKMQCRPVPPLDYSAGWKNFIPDAEALGLSTVFLREWVGIIWYDVLEKFHEGKGIEKWKDRHDEAV